MAPGYDWYLKEWLATLGKRQADIVRDLGWNKARVSLMLRGKQPYDRDSLNELATYLHLKPHELLMHPEDAMALRQLKIVAGKIVQIPFAGSAGDEDSEIKVSAA
jgi:transcriptional regulator with XRE-family HTH domain